jgi:hypothetical protein
MMPRIFALVLVALITGSLALVPAAPAEASNTVETDFNATASMAVASPGQPFADAEGNRYFQGVVYTGQLSGWPVTGTLRIDANIAFQAGSSSGEIDGSYVITDGSGNSFRGDLSESRVQETGSGLALRARLNIEGGTGMFDDARGNARIAGVLPSLGPSPAAFGSFNPSFNFAPGFNPQALGFNGLIPNQQFGAFPNQQFGAFPNAGVNPWQVSSAQPTLLISGTLSVNPEFNTNAWWNQSFPTFPGATNFQDLQSNPAALRAFRNALRDFLDDDDNDRIRPGNGWGDRNHEHTGPPGQNNNNGNRGNNNRGRGRGRD